MGFQKKFYLLLTIFVFFISSSQSETASTQNGVLQQVRAKMAAALSGPLSRNEFPAHFDIYYDDQKWKAIPTYTVHWNMQHYMESMFKHYKPDYGAFVAIDASTGKILALVSHQSRGKQIGNLALRSTFPSASVFKIVTAAAAIDQGKISPDTEISFVGSNHTLYKRNLAQNENNKWARKMTLSEAFAKSVNTVFAKIGIQYLTPHLIRDYAERFMYTKGLSSDLPIQPSQFELSDNDPWTIAEITSGFNRNSTLSPVQGAMMAAIVANDGNAMTPFLIQNLTTEDKRIIFQAGPELLSKSISIRASRDLRTLMQETVKTGTSSRYFRSLLKKLPDTVEVGGKTGTLSGNSPQGKYDWFVGYTKIGKQKIGFCALTINENFWKVKSSFIARTFVEQLSKTNK